MVSSKQNKNLLSRDEFREGVFKRDGYKCVICKSDAKDAHHIIERRLWTLPEEQGGYFLDNGASLCEKCHILAEQTVLSCEEIRKAAKIENVIIPSHLYRDLNYDKWSNPILPNGTRLKGELFFDESVQKILKDGNVLDLFTKYVKYPRTFHVPYSPGTTKDDRVLKDMDYFKDKEVVVSAKLDGENTSLYSDYIHARSLDYEATEYRSWIKVIWSKVCGNIPEGWRVCGENVSTKHSIHYKNLESYFYVFSIWNEKNECLSWNETKEWADLLELKTVPVLYEGIYDEDKIKSLWKPMYGENEMEGWVLRISDKFTYGDFRKSICKYVRENHVNTTHHWKREKFVKNELIDGIIM